MPECVRRFNRAELAHIPAAIAPRVQFMGSVSLEIRDGFEGHFEETLEQGGIHIFEGANNARVTSTLFNLVKIEVVNADFFWIDNIAAPVDAILFFESFHPRPIR